MTVQNDRRETHELLKEYIRHMSETHNLFQSRFAEAQAHYLRTMENLVRSALGEITTGQELLSSLPEPRTVLSAMPPDIPVVPERMNYPEVLAAAPIMAPAATLGQKIPVAAPVSVLAPVAASKESVAEVLRSESINHQMDYKKLLLNVVAEKTGYPEEMLDLNMELEAGLGIDSIKRVEILAVLQERTSFDMLPSDFAGLQTLQDIVDCLETRCI